MLRGRSSSEDSQLPHGIAAKQRSENLGLGCRGVVWYQGEGNTRRADEYHKLFSTMIKGWRKAFGHEFPFYFAQISPFQYRDVNAAYLREAQMQTLSLPHTGMAVTMDIGNLTDIHPKNKQEVGRRLALWALAKQYGKDVVCSGPLYKMKTIEDGRIRLKFDHVGEGLATRDGKAPQRSPPANVADYQG